MNNLQSWPGNFKRLKYVLISTLVSIILNCLQLTLLSWEISLTCSTLHTEAEGRFLRMWVNIHKLYCHLSPHLVSTIKCSPDRSSILVVSSTDEDDGAQSIMSAPEAQAEAPGGPWKAPAFACHLLKKVLELTVSYQPLTEHFKNCKQKKIKVFSKITSLYIRWKNTEMFLKEFYRTCCNKISKTFIRKQQRKWQISEPHGSQSGGGKGSDGDNDALTWHRSCLLTSDLGAQSRPWPRLVLSNPRRNSGRQTWEHNCFLQDPFWSQPIISHLLD